MDRRNRWSTDDFVAISPTARRHDKAAGVKAHSVTFASNRVDSLMIRFYGADIAVAVGSEAWRKKDGSSGRTLWTDTWVRRQGKWQVVADALQAVIPVK